MKIIVKKNCVRTRGSGRDDPSAKVSVPVNSFGYQDEVDGNEDDSEAETCPMIGRMIQPSLHPTTHRTASPFLCVFLFKQKQKEKKKIEREIGNFTNSIQHLFTCQ